MDKGMKSYKITVTDSNGDFVHSAETYSLPKGLDFIIQSDGQSYFLVKFEGIDHEPV
jgi:hypothetical protein